jgi:hypothetical protein
MYDMYIIYGLLNICNSTFLNQLELFKYFGFLIFPVFQVGLSR